MKLCVVTAAISIFSVLLTSMVSAYSISDGYALGELGERNVVPNDLKLFLRAYEDGAIDARSLMTILSKFKTSKAERERIKKFKEGSKEYRKTGKKIAAEAKKDMGKNYNVKVLFYGPGQAEYGEKVEKLVQAGWHSHKNLQQYRTADVTVKVLPSGRKMATARFHNGLMAGASTTYLFD